MSFYQTFIEVIFAENLIKRWSLTIQEIEQIIQSGRLKPYFLKDKRKQSDGREYYLCEIIAGRKWPRTAGIWGEDSYLVENVVFSASEVYDYEGEYSYLKDSVVSALPSQQEKEWLWGGEIQDALKMSPDMFCSFVNNNKVLL
jgi:hypothetical protein